MRTVAGFAVPVLMGHHPDLWVIEMALVSPPFVLDFAGASLDKPSADFPPHVLRQWEAEKREVFGDRWPLVRRVISEFRAMGIYLADVHRGNIDFGDAGADDDGDDDLSLSPPFEDE